MTLTLSTLRAMTNIITKYRASSTPEIQENPMIGTLEPKRLHRKRHGQSRAYHARVQKKWMKRFGTWLKPGAVIIDREAAGIGQGKLIVAHPVVAAEIRKRFQESAP